MKGKRFSELDEDLQVAITERTIAVRIAKRQLTQEEISLFFSRRQETKTTTVGEHLNANLRSNLREPVVALLASAQQSFLSIGIPVAHPRNKGLERLAQMLYVSQQDKSKGQELAQSYRLYDIEAPILKSWWGADSTKASPEDIRAVEKLAEALAFLLGPEVKFKGGNGTKGHLLTLCCYIHRFCWSPENDDIDETKLKRTRDRLLAINAEHPEGIYLGTSRHGVQVMTINLVNFLTSAAQAADE